MTPLPVTQPTCACGCGQEPADPELDAREIPHAIRHAAVFGALDSIQVGSAMVLVAPHDPLPLLAQAQQRYGDAFAVAYQQRGPDAWRIRFARTA